MASCYKNILISFSSSGDLYEAIVTNNASLYYFLVHELISESQEYREMRQQYGNALTDQLLIKTMIVFQQQVKFNKLEFQIGSGRISVNKNPSDLIGYLKSLLRVIVETGQHNRNYKHFIEFETRLINGEGFRKLYDLKQSVMNALNSFGCRDSLDGEELFHEALLIFRKKLIDNEIGLFYTGGDAKIQDWQVFNRKFYQYSRLSTFITGIAKNLFNNKLRTAEFKQAKNKGPDITELNICEMSENESENPVMMMFVYYRSEVEERKLRSVISLLQYDCGFEDNDIRKLLGLNNARIHSSRLRAHFTDWYYLNLKRLPEFIDETEEYFRCRELKKEKLNLKIRNLDWYRRNQISQPDLTIFKEEFRSQQEFNKLFRIFSRVFYLSGIGKPSTLVGQPDEKSTRKSLELLRKKLFELSGIHVILYMLYYGSDETEESIVNLIRSLRNELFDQKNDFIEAYHSLDQMLSSNDENRTVLSDILYQLNNSLFEQLLNEPDFFKPILDNETVQNTF
ncbi:MAG: hypothetical protein V1775_03745 [Bacteroidota bacterium]